MKLAVFAIPGHGEPRFAAILVRLTTLVTLSCAAPGTDDTLAAATPTADIGAQHTPAPSSPQDTIRRDSVADLPRVTVDPRPVPSTGKTIRVGARGNLQSALNSAQPGDAVLGRLATRRGRHRVRRA